jgi:phospholysine phosphohistidine inorganic pyrophosphate phosphatase
MFYIIPLENEMRGILFDLDGVLYDSKEPIDGASQALAWVRTKQIPHLFVTNTTSRGRIALAEKLQRFGIQAEISQIMTPCNSAAEWLRTQKDGKAALFVNPKAYVEFEGVDCVPEEAETGARYVLIAIWERLGIFSN